MPTLVVNDPGIGEGLGHLMGGLAAGNDPEKRARAMALQAQIDQHNLKSRQIQMENESFAQQRKIQDETANTLAGQLTPDMLSKRLPQTIIPGQETLRQPFGEGFQGPLPASPVRNPQLDEVARRSQAAQQIARFVISRGGTPQQAVDAAYKALELGGIYGAGALPATEGAARTSQTLLTGQIPDAKTPLTEQQRRVMDTEARAQAAALEAQRQAGAFSRNEADNVRALEATRIQQAGALDRVYATPRFAPENSTPFATPEQRSRWGLDPTGAIPVQRSAGKGETVETPGRGTLYGQGAGPPDPNAPTTEPILGSGKGFDQEANRTVLRLLALEEKAPGTLTRPQLREYAAAYKKAVEDSTWQAIEVDDPTRPGQTIKKWEQRPGGAAPLGFMSPQELWAKYGLGPAPEASPSSTPRGGPAGGQASVTPPVSASTVAATAVPPAQAQASTPQGGPGNVIGTVGADKGAPEHMANSYTYTKQAEDAVRNIDRILAENPTWQPSFSAGVMGAAATAGGQANQSPMGAMVDQLSKQIIGGVNTSINPIDAQIQSHERSLLVAILRDDTGAAIAPSEFGYYRDMLVPSWNDSPTVRQEKRERVHNMVVARQKGRRLTEIMSDVGLPAPDPSKIVRGNPGEQAPAASAGQAVRVAPSSEPAATPPPSPQSPPTNPSSPQIPEGAPVGTRSGEWFFNPRTRRRERAP